MAARSHVTSLPHNPSTLRDRDGLRTFFKNPENVVLERIEALNTEEPGLAYARRDANVTASMLARAPSLCGVSRTGCTTVGDKLHTLLALFKNASWAK